MKQVTPMSAFRILNCEPDHYSSEALKILESLGRVDLMPVTRQQLLESISDYDVLIVRLGFQIDREVFESAQKLKVIVSATTGLDHIDLQVADEHAVRVLSLKGEVEFLRSIPATAELTWGLLLALVRHIPSAVQSVHTGDWDREAFRGRDLAGKTLAIVGLGRIGEKVARYGLAFGMRVIAFDPAPERWLDGVERKSSLSALLHEAQVLSIHVPLNQNTLHLIGRDELSALPDGAVMINTSRGDVLDENALLWALQSGKIAGAALDVIQGERDSARAESALLAYAKSHDNLIVTPHIGGATFDSMAATEVFMATKLANYLNAWKEK